MKLGENWPGSFREDAKRYNFIHVYSPRAGAEKIWGHQILIVMEGFATSIIYCKF